LVSAVGQLERELGRLRVSLRWLVAAVVACLILAVLMAALFA
jgi:hypothetical protein